LRRIQVKSSNSLPEEFKSYQQQKERLAGTEKSCQR
jgi:hypothetical protein